jgi:CBS domain containing-hemolysin-like protein
LGHAPKAGDEVRLDSYLLRVEEVDGARVARVVARKDPA